MKKRPFVQQQQKIKKQTLEHFFERYFEIKKFLVQKSGKQSLEKPLKKSRSTYDKKPFRGLLKNTLHYLCSEFQTCKSLLTL